jgi:hypothetical protein
MKKIEITDISQYKIAKMIETYRTLGYRCHIESGMNRTFLIIEKKYE